MWKEFKEFIAQGSVMDAAIGFVLGLAFKAIIDSVVNGLLMP
ncbi:MAG: MscL family protein, partial [Clostridiaceae bacterium]|nr:MscL family protein [Clostridiaceae bacterium]